VSADIVTLAPGANIVLDLREDEDVTTITAEAGAGVEDPYYRQKYVALSGLTESDTPSSPVTGPYPDPFSGITPTGPAWDFSYLSMWISAFSGVSGDPISGAFFFAEDECFGVGEFEDENR